MALCLTGGKGLNGIYFINQNPVSYVNFKKICNWKTGILLFLSTFLVSTGVIAQAPKYVPPPPPTKHITLQLRLRYLIAPDIAFSGLGNIPYNEPFTISGNLIEGTERSIIYDDGYLTQDYMEADIIDDSLGSEFLPSDNSNATSAFNYQNPDQVDRELDPTTLMFHRYAATLDPSVEFEGSGNGSLGWELSYTKFINPRRNLGIQVGFSFNGFDSRFHDSIQADLYTITYKHQMADGMEVPELQEVTDEDGNVSYIPYTGDNVLDPDGENKLLEWLTSEEATEELLEGGATVDTRADLRSSVYNFRAGPTYTVDMGELFSFQVGAGVSAQFVNGRFSTFEILSNTTAVNAPRQPMNTTEEAEWQVGGYLDANAAYNLTERVSWFSGMQVQTGSTYSQANEERFATVDFSNQIFIHTGVGIKF